MTTTIDNEQKTLNVPNLRFPEFEGEWQKCRLGDVCNTSTGNKNTQDKTDDGIYPFYVRSQTVERINSWTFDGEAILTAGDGVGVGKVFHHTYGKIGVHQRVYILSDFKCDANYLFHFFSSKFYNRVKRMSAKNSVDSVRKEMITDMPLSLPCCQEQVKIGYMLSILDERISTQNKIIEELKKLKVCVRRLIFRTLNCSWFLLSELEASGDICLKRGNIIPKHEHTDIFCYPVYSSSVQNGGLMGYNNTYMFNTELVTWSIDGGGNFFYRHKHKFNVTNVSGYMQLNEAKYNYRFVSEILLWQHSFMVFDYQTKAHPSVIRSIYKLPDVSLAEQELIANIFRLLDVKLQNEMTILKQYQQQKQYLLRQMFI